MPMKVRDAGGVLRTITRMHIRDGGTLRRVLRMKVMDGAELRTVATFVLPLSLSITPSTTGGSSFGSNVTTDPVTASPSGGLGPYSYAWTKLSGSGSVNSPSTASTTFSASGVSGSGDIFEGTFRCTCTDSSGQTATADVTASFYFATPFG